MILAVCTPGHVASAIHDAAQILREEVPLMPLWQVYAINAAKKTIDFTPTIDEQFYVFDIGVK